VINDEVNWAKWVDLLSITTESLHGISHGSQIYDSWDAGEILQDDSGRLEGNFKILLRALTPVEDSLNISL
jgi:hypothetical protein